MTIDTTVSDVIKARIREEYEKKEKEHQRSGKLSASILGWALQWQVLKHLQVPQSQVDDYTLCKFKRGDHVESFIHSYIGDHEKQIEVNYKGCIGYLDVLYNGIPHEVKSVSNAKFKNIQKSNQADPQHRLQGAFYALGLGLPEYVIDYVASDDYRILSMRYKAQENKNEIDYIIDTYNEMIENHVVPVFQARYPWQENQMYNPYPAYQIMSQEELDRTLIGLNIIWP